MVNRRTVTKLQTQMQRVEVLNEGKVRKRKHQRPGRCHRDDEKERRKDIAAQFDSLKEFLPKVKKNRTRQEILGCTRELLWELWRNEEILSLASVNQMECKISELEKLVVMKRDKKRQLEAIRRTASSVASTDYEVEVEESDVTEVTSRPRHVTSILKNSKSSDPAEIVTEIVGSEGYVLEEVLPAELYEQLVHDQQSRSGQHTPCGDFNLSAEEELSEAAKIVQDTFKVEQINNEMMSDEIEIVNGESGEIAEVMVCEDEDDDEFESVDPDEITQKSEGEEEDCNQGSGGGFGDNHTNMANEGDNCENYRFDLNSSVEQARQSENGAFAKFPITMPSFNNYFMPFQLWPAFIQPDQPVPGYPGFPVTLDQNPSCAYNNVPVPARISPPPRSSLDMLLTQDMSGQAMINDCVTSGEVSGNVDVVN